MTRVNVCPIARSHGDISTAAAEQMSIIEFAIFLPTPVCVLNKARSHVHRFPGIFNSHQNCVNKEKQVF
jgi:hypothetical protein